MRRIVCFLVACLAASAGPASAQTPLKIGYINSEAILDQTPGAQEAQQQWTTEMEALRSQLQPAADSLEQMIQQYEAQSLTMSPEAKRNREQAIRQRQEALQQRASQLETRAGQRRAELVQPVMDRVSRVIEEIRVEGSYHLIFDAAAGSIIAADESLDLTDEVVRRLQASSGPGSRD
jgi:outer membrane protein